MYTTFLASAFRSIRFGVNEAHGRGIAVQLNALLDAGAFTVAADGTFAVDAAKIKPAVEALTRDILLLQARGDYAAAKKMIDALAVVRPEVKRALDRLGQRAGRHRAAVCHRGPAREGAVDRRRPASPQRRNGARRLPWPERSRRQPARAGANVINRREPWASWRPCRSRRARRHAGTRRRHGRPAQARAWRPRRRRQRRTAASRRARPGTRGTPASRLRA